MNDPLYTGGVVAVALAAVELAKMAIRARQGRNGNTASFTPEDRKTLRLIHEKGIERDVETLLTLRRIDAALMSLPAEIRRAVIEGMKEGRP